MAIPKTSRRGLSNIKTSSASKVTRDKPHLAYLRLGSLEMERQHRLLERSNAVRRIQELDIRLRQLEAEKARLLSVVEQRPAVEATQTTVPPRTVSTTAPRRPEPVDRKPPATEARAASPKAATATPPVKGERGAAAESDGFRFRY